MEEAGIRAGGPLKGRKKRDSPGVPVVKTLSFQCRGHGFSPWFQGTKMPHTVWLGQKSKKKEEEEEKEGEVQESPPSEMTELRAEAYTGQSSGKRMRRESREHMQRSCGGPSVDYVG